MGWLSRRFSQADSPGDAVNKAMPALPAGAKATALPSSAELVRQLQNMQAALHWAEPDVPFGPGAPAPSRPINPPDDGRFPPRQTEYDTSWNLPGAGRKLIPWGMLRDAADVDLVRALIEAKKAELSGIEWDVTIGKRALDNAIALQPDTPRSQLEKQMRDKLAPEIARACDFWLKPDPDNGLEWADWLGVLLEEVLVLDALAVYPARNVGGELRSLWVLDGTTVKPLLDGRGMRPAPPNPAFQQILYGFPRGDYAADTDPDGHTAGGMSADELVYRRRVVRAWTPYGFSAVERALPIIGLLAARDSWIRSEYSDGAKPDVFMTPVENSGVEMANFRLWEQTINNLLAGDSQEKRRIQLGIPGSKIDQLEHDAERYKPDYDLYIVKRLAAHFDLPITEIGFTEAKGLGSAGFHEGQDDVNQRRNILPWTSWLASLCSGIQARYMGIPAELEFTFLGLDDEDEAATEQVVDMRTKGGRATLNEGRDRLGLPRYDFPEADAPFIVAGREVVFLNGEMARQESARTQAAQTVTGGQAAVGGTPGAPGTFDPAMQDQPGMTGKAAAGDARGRG